ncbi:MAG: ScpA family protein, partial [Pseudomonadota bacterium]
RVDLARLSIATLAEQYLAYIAEARLRIDIAADYLVMAAWLAWLKSRLLLPPEPQAEGPSAEDLAARLADRLRRLDAMRTVATALMARERLGQGIFARGASDLSGPVRRFRLDARLDDLLRAYARLRTRDDYRPLQMERPQIVAMEEALARLATLCPDLPEWSELVAFLPHEWIDTPERRRSALASSFAASLELARQGRVELRQEGAFAPLYLRAKAAEPAAEPADQADVR